ncbi:hypothetical protein HanPI659440_Chr13g0512491 [Helianthus annuus]|nr:hypothetical protein HanPI659440_Chr13g0512491 [Helianthus annuus]
MAELNSQLPRSVAGGGTTTFNEHSGSPLNVVPHNLLPDFAFNEDEDALGESRVVEDPEPISTEFPSEVFYFENENVGDSGESRCIRPQICIQMAPMMMRMVFRIVLLQSCYPHVSFYLKACIFSLVVFFYETSFYIF